MPINYPTSLDTFTNPDATGGDTLAAVPHDAQHGNANDAIEALEAKVGIGASTPSRGAVLAGTATTTRWRSSSVADVRDYGVIADGVTDDTAALQAAITANEAPLWVPGMCLISDPLVVRSSVLKLWGGGRGGYRNISSTTATGPGSRSGFIWGGDTWSSGGMDATTMLIVEPDAASNAPRLVNVELLGLGFRGASKAGRAVAFRSVMDGRVDIWLDHVKGVGFEMGAVANADLGDWTDPQGNDIRVAFDQSATGDGVGVLLDWQPNGSDANTSLNVLSYIHGFYNDSDAVVYGSTDNILALQIRTIQQGSAPYGYGLRLKASNSAGGHSRSNYFVSVSVGTGGMLSEGTEFGTEPAARNVIATYDKQSGGIPDPTIGTGSTLYWTGNDDAGSHVTREGIRFPATAKPSTDPNTLDDYEEGTWTPTVGFSTAGDLAVTYTMQVGSYTRIGRLVIAHYRVQASAFTHTTASGSFRVRTLPFAPVVPTNGYQSSAVVMRGYTKSGFTDLVGIVNNNDSSVYVAAGGSGVTQAVLAVADVPSGGIIDISGTVIYTAA